MYCTKNSSNTTQAPKLARLNPIAMERFSVLCLLGMLLSLLHTCIMCLAIPPSNITDQLALLAFKNKITFDPDNTLARNWTVGTNFCHWIGISCSRQRHRVTHLQLSFMGLQGTISPYIGNLSLLVSLDIANNSFGGHLPYELGNLSGLKTLILACNQLVGAIPPTLSRCRALQILSLQYNKFSSGIPEELGILPNLKSLNLGWNSFVGRIPSSLGNISTLSVLSLSTNSLSGPIPSLIFNLTSLKRFNVFQNYLSGTFPVDICHNCPELVEIVLAENQFTGLIPSTIHKCTKLELLDLSKNRFEGNIPKEISNLQMLEQLYVMDNNISGTIPLSLVNNSRLVVLYSQSNNIHGNIPDELGSLSNLAYLSFGDNVLTGSIPKAIFNLSRLEDLDFSWNTLSGSLPQTIGISLPLLQLLYLQQNELSGEFPLHLSNCSELTELYLNENSLSGQVPINLGDLQQLNRINIASNQLTVEPANSQLTFLNSLTNSTSLEILVISYNNFNGFFPNSIGYSSSPLQLLSAVRCQIQGHIPQGIGSFKNLLMLDLSENHLNGMIPATIRRLDSLQLLLLSSNMLDGMIPNELCHLGNMGLVLLQQNKLSGQIPACLGNLTNLQRLDLSSNGFNSLIPLSLWTLKELIFMNLSFNSFSSNIPNSIAELDAIEVIDLSSNKISGSIPNTTSSLQRLRSLNLSNNSLQGSIPQTVGSLLALESLDLSHNNLSGVIPKSLESLKYLRQLNLSFNKLSGEIPSKGPFKNFTAQSFFENEALCGNVILEVPPCKHMNSKTNSSKEILLKFVLPAVASLVSLVALLYLLRTYRSSNARVPNAIPLVLAAESPMISYFELLHATNNFSEANLLGVGSIGSVYKGMLSEGTAIAVKVFNLQVESAVKSFNAECEVLRTVRHRNLVKVISSCSNPDFRALILQYMPNGSLESWLYSHNYFLSLIQRVSVMVDIALGLEYLHLGLPEPIVHCDLKPNNVLLDDEMVAHVGDFGIAKVLAENRTTAQTSTLGTLGYIAPEYGSEGRVSTKCDVYSYGIILLEMLTRKKPTDEMFSANMSLRQWVRAAFPDNIMEVADQNLFSVENGVAAASRDHLSAIFQLGLDCSNDSAEDRSDMAEVAVRIKKIKSQLLTNA